MTSKSFSRPTSRSGDCATMRCTRVGKYSSRVRPLMVELPGARHEAHPSDGLLAAAGRDLGCGHCHVLTPRSRSFVAGFFASPSWPSSSSRPASSRSSSWPSSSSPWSSSRRRLLRGRLLRRGRLLGRCLLRGGLFAHRLVGLGLARGAMAGLQFRDRLRGGQALPLGRLSQGVGDGLLGLVRVLGALLRRAACCIIARPSRFFGQHAPDRLLDGERRDGRAAGRRSGSP